jgi:hypothetical protein
MQGQSLHGNFTNMVMRWVIYEGILQCQVSNFSEIQGVVISARATVDSLELVLETDLTQQDFMQQWLVLALLFV